MDGYDLIVIGGGTSGFIVAIGAIRLGLKVAMIEKNSSLGGLSLHNGCVHSKTILHVAHTANTVRQATQYGLDTAMLPVDLSKVNNYVNQLANELVIKESYDVHNLFQQLGGAIIFGVAQFIDVNKIAVNDQVLQAKKFVVATGSRPLLPCVKGLDNIGYITTNGVFNQQKLWQKLVIIGGHPAAIEFAQAFARLGCKVSIVINSDSILPQEDPELVSKIKDALLLDGIDIYLNVAVQTAYMERHNKVLECVHDSGETFTVSGDQILAAIGGSPNVEGLGLENAGIKYNSEGILVDRLLQTSCKHIYALGDVINSPYKLTHMAEYQANILLSNMLFRSFSKVKYQGFPYVIFTDPEYAHVGLSEQQARANKYKKIEIFRFDFKDLDSAIINNSSLGMIKVVTSKGRVIGASIFGPHASNLITEWSLAIKMRAKLADVAATIHAYPTLAQINRRVASKQSTKRFFLQRNYISTYHHRILAMLFDRP